MYNMFEAKLKLFPQTNLNKYLYNNKSKQRWIQITQRKILKNHPIIGELTTALCASIVYVYISCTQQSGWLELYSWFVGTRLGWEGQWVNHLAVGWWVITGMGSMFTVSWQDNNQTYAAYRLQCLPRTEQTVNTIERKILVFVAWLTCAIRHTVWAKVDITVLN
jgi:hypothetical protein